MNSHRTRDKSTGIKLFTLVDHASSQSSLNSSFRGIQALSQAKIDKLSISSLSSIAGHTVVAFDSGKRFVVFDACSVSESRSVSQSIISRIAKFISHHAVGASTRSSSDIVSHNLSSICLSDVDNILAVSSTNGYFCHLQFLPVEPKHSLPHSHSFSSHDVNESESAAHLMTLQSNGEIVIYRFISTHDSDQQCVSRWESICSTFLPLTQPTSSKHSPIRTVSSAYYSLNHSSIYWVESSANTSFAGIYTALINQSSKLDSGWNVASSTSVQLLPLDINHSQHVHFYAGVNGLFISVTDDILPRPSNTEATHEQSANVEVDVDGTSSSTDNKPVSLYYWDSNRSMLQKINETSLSRKCLFVHPQIGSLMALRPNGNVIQFVESDYQQSNNHSNLQPIASSCKDNFYSPIIVKHITTLQLSVVSPVALNKFVVFQQMFGVFTSLPIDASINTQYVSELHLFSAWNGVSMSPPINCHMLDSSSFTVHAVRHGLGGTGVIVSDKSRLLVLRCESVNQLIDTITSTSPFDVQQKCSQLNNNDLPLSATFADPSISSPFEVLNKLSFGNPADHDDSDTEHDFGNNETNGSLLNGEQSLIPDIPYPIHSELAMHLAERWGPSLRPVWQSFALKRWIGLTTARSIDHIMPPGASFNPSNASASPDSEEELILSAVPLGSSALQESNRSAKLPVESVRHRFSGHEISSADARVAALSECCSALGSPAIPISLLTLPSVSHAQHGHVFDAAQQAETLKQLRVWLQEMHLVEQAAHQSTEVDHALLDRYTPLNMALYPALETFERAASQFESLADHLDIDQPIQDSFHQPVSRLFPAQLQLPLTPTLNQTISHAVTHRSSFLASNGNERSLHSLVVYEPHATLAYLKSFMGLDGLQHLNQSNNQPLPDHCTPNLMLLNEEIKLKKELGVFGLDVAINAAALQRSESMPIFELLCRLFDRCEPVKLAAFVQLMTNVSMPPPETLSQSIKQSASHRRPRGSQDFNETDASVLFQRPIICPTPAHMNYFDRALYCLPAIDINEHSYDSDLFEDRVAARCELLARSSRLVDAVLLRLKMAIVDAKRRAQHEEAAIELASSISSEAINQSINHSTVLARALSLTPAALLNDQLMPLRAELYNHLRRHFEETHHKLDRLRESASSDYVSDTDDEDPIHACLDSRIRSLRGQQLRVHDYYELIRNQLASQKQVSQMLANQTFELSDTEDDLEYEHVDQQPSPPDENHQESRNGSSSTLASSATDSGIGISSLAKDFFRLGETLGETVKSLIGGPSEQASETRR